MIWHPVEQNTNIPCPCCGKTWMELRAGKVTGSSIAKIMANYPNQFGEPAKRLAVSIASYSLGGQWPENNYTNAEMERGQAEEPIARALYQSSYFVAVTNGGFFDNGDTGSSPDGISKPHGLQEIKSVIDSTFYPIAKSKKFDPTYRWQYIFNMKEAGADWIDCIYFCSTMPDEKRLYVYRMYAKSVKKEYAMIEKRLERFRGFVRETKRNISKF